MGESQNKATAGISCQPWQNAFNSEKKHSGKNQRRMTLCEEISNYVMTSNWYPGMSSQTKTQDTKSTSS